MLIKHFDYIKAVAYAEKWALSRNPNYFNFDGELLGGDCTNFVSQCIFAGSGVMNYTKTFGWYYTDLNRRAPAWTGVQYLYNFLTTNTKTGPFGHQIPLSKVSTGDIIQLSFNGERMSHSLFVVDTAQGEIFIACHSADALYKPFSDYSYINARAIHIDGVR